MEKMDILVFGGLAIATLFKLSKKRKEVVSPLAVQYKQLQDSIAACRGRVAEVQSASESAQLTEQQQAQALAAYKLQLEAAQETLASITSKPTTPAAPLQTNCISNDNGTLSRAQLQTMLNSAQSTLAAKKAKTASAFSAFKSATTALSQQESQCAEAVGRALHLCPDLSKMPAVWSAPNANGTCSCGYGGKSGVNKTLGCPSGYTDLGNGQCCAPGNLDYESDSDGSVISISPTPNAGARRDNAQRALKCATKGGTSVPSTAPEAQPSWAFRGNWIKMMTPTTDVGWAAVNSLDCHLIYVDWNGKPSGIFWEMEKKCPHYAAARVVDTDMLAAIQAQPNFTLLKPDPTRLVATEAEMICWGPASALEGMPIYVDKTPTASTPSPSGPVSLVYQGKLWPIWWNLDVGVPMGSTAYINGIAAALKKSLAPMLYDAIIGVPACVYNSFPNSTTEPNGALDAFSFGLAIYGGQIIKLDGVLQFVHPTTFQTHKVDVPCPTTVYAPTVTSTPTVLSDGSKRPWQKAFSAGVPLSALQNATEIIGQACGVPCTLNGNELVGFTRLGLHPTQPAIVCAYDGVTDVPSSVVKTDTHYLDSTTTLSMEAWASQRHIELKNLAPPTCLRNKAGACSTPCNLTLSAFCSAPDQQPSWEYRGLWVQSPLRSSAEWCHIDASSGIPTVFRPKNGGKKTFIVPVHTIDPLAYNAIVSQGSAVHWAPDAAADVAGPAELAFWADGLVGYPIYINAPSVGEDYYFVADSSTYYYVSKTAAGTAGLRAQMPMMASKAIGIPQCVIATLRFVGGAPPEPAFSNSAKGLVALAGSVISIDGSVPVYVDTTEFKTHAVDVPTVLETQKVSSASAGLDKSLVQSGVPASKLPPAELERVKGVDCVIETAPLTGMQRVGPYSNAGEFGMTCKAPDKAPASFVYPSSAKTAAERQSAVESWAIKEGFPAQYPTGINCNGERGELCPNVFDSTLPCATCGPDPTIFPQ
jgi:hypothetical protein